MAKWDKDYLNLCKEILRDGEEVENRTGVNTIKVPYKAFEFDLKDEFPILTTKYVAWKTAILEMLWFYQAQSNDVRWLQDRDIKIWNEWQADENGIYREYNKDGGIKSEKNLGPEFAYTIGTAYGYIVREYQLIQKLIDTLKNNPTDRRMIMSLWQDKYLNTATLPSCVWNSMWDVTNGKLNTVVTQRSCDVALGLPFNVTQYAVLQHMIAQVTGYEVGKLYWSTKDAHIYVNQIDGINEQLKTYEEQGDFSAPKLILNPEINDFFAFDNSKDLKDIQIEGYQHHKKIKMPIAR
jgi:thymidylate synthase